MFIKLLMSPHASPLGAGQYLSHLYIERIAWSGTYFVLSDHSLKELNKIPHSRAMLDHPGLFLPDGVKHRLLGP